MAFSNYEELKVAARNWTRRNDIDRFIDDVIDIVETEIYANEIEPLSVRELETRATAVTVDGSRYVALPAGYLSMRRLQITNTNNTDLEIRTPEALIIKQDSGRPRYFSATSQIEFDRVPDAIYDLEMLYYKRPDALSSSNTTNAILTAYPNIYLHGCMWATYDFAGEEARTAQRYTRFISAIKGANKKDRRARFGSAPVMATERSTP